jgi:outer membrane beta-barrel protein
MKHIIFVFLLCFSSFAFGQDDNSIDDIEGLFDREEKADERRSEREAERREKQAKKDEAPEPKEIEDLKQLETFDDIAVIQRRYLPKTGRFEFYIAGGTNLNDAFFVGNGLSARFGYHLREKWALEGIYSFIQNDNRDVTNELLEAGVNTEGSVSTDGYYGIDLKWTPIYGKYAYFNEKIIPFDLYFSFGVGKTDPRLAASSSSTEQFEVESPYTVKFGTGQIFAITKWMAFRWDMSLHMIQAKTTVTDPNNGNVIREDESLSNNLFLNVGLSFFFPEAKYR